MFKTYGVVFLLVLGSLLGNGPGAQAETVSMEPSPGLNLAAGRPCTFTVSPNYGYCTGDSDPQDLTDGQYWQPKADPEAHFWTQAGTVGWQQSSPAGIQIDLGEVQAIDTVTLDSAAGSSQVTYPGAALLYVSDEGETWYYVTDLINEAIPQNRFSRHRFVAADLHTRGRYVMIYLIIGGFYMFADEIEVLGGTHDPAAVEFAVDPLPTAQLEAAAEARGQLSKQKNTSLYFIAAAQAALEQAPEATAAQTELEVLARQAVARDQLEPEDHPVGPPFTDLDRQVGQVVGKCWSRFAPAVTVWSPEPSLWAPLGPFDRPPEAPLEALPSVALHADMMGNEYEAVAFNLSNNREQPIRVHLSVSDLVGRSGRMSSSAVTLREVIFAEASGFRLYADALPEVQDGTVNIAAGLTKQIWLTLDSAGVAPGTYQGQVLVRPRRGSPTALPLQVEVYPVIMPEQPSYLTTLFSYFSWAPVIGREEATARDLTTHYANAEVLHHGYIPWPQVDDNKNPLQPIELDFTKLDEMIAYRPDVQLWILWPGMEFGYWTLGTNRAFGAPGHAEMFKEWARQIRDHMQDRGIGTDRWCFMWQDEPGDESWKKNIVPASRMAKEVDPSILVWEDQQVSLELLQETDDCCDIYCPPLDHVQANPDIHQFILGQEHPGWQYVCASSKEGDPHSYYRLHHWHSWDLGFNGAGMWVYTDDLGTWNDYAGGTSYSMIYEGPEGPITSKRWEAWRDGIEDVELLRHVRQIVETTGDDQLRRLLEKAPQRALEQPEAPEVLLALRSRLLRSLR